MVYYPHAHLQSFSPAYNRLINERESLGGEGGNLVAVRCGAAPRDSSNNGRLLSIGANAKYCGDILFCDVNVKYDSTRPPFPGFTGTPHFKRGSVMDADFCENLANGEPTSHGGQLLSEAEAKLSGDNEAL